MKTVSHNVLCKYLLEYVASQYYNNTNVNNVPGEDTNMAGMTLNQIHPQVQSNSCNTGSTSHRKDNNR